MDDLRVVRAAIRGDHYGIHSVPIPGRHHDVIAEMRENGYSGPVGGDRQGFLLNDGRFVMRKAAARIAIKAGQCETIPHPGIGLFSEDVW